MDFQLKNLFDRVQEQFGLGPGLGLGSGACLMNIEDISPMFIKSLYKAAAALYRTDPWRRLRPGHLFGFKVGKDSDWPGKKQPFPCVNLIGGDGGDVAVYMYRSVADARKMLAPTETVRTPNVELLRVTYQAESLLFPSNKKMIKTLSLEASDADKYPVIDVGRFMSSGELRFRNPSVEELRFAYASMVAMTLVHPLLQEDRGGGPKWSNSLYFEPFIETVDVEWGSEMAPKNQKLVAVSVFHPPGQTYEEKTSTSSSSTPTKYGYGESREETFGDIETY